MKVLNFKTKSFRKVPNPFYNSDNLINNSEMYIMICDVKDIPKDIPMETNPREQKLNTAVAKKIRASLSNERSNNFYLLNRGLTISAKSNPDPATIQDAITWPINFFLGVRSFKSSITPTANITTTPRATP